VTEPARPEPAEDGGAAPPEARTAWRLPALLLVASTASVWFVGAEVWGSGWQLAVPLMSILVAHESGHYFVARWHGERPSLPYFLPLPWGNPFGTLGAVLLLDSRRRSRSALLDIGAAGPLAGLMVAVPLLLLGLSLSPVEPLPATGYAQEGQSIAYWLAKRLVLGPIPPGQDVTMHPVLGAAWGGLFVTFLNLLPVGQLDGGHVAYALLGRRGGRLMRALALLPSALVVYNALAFAGPWLLGWGAAPVAATSWLTLSSAVLPWALLQALILLMWRWGALDHGDVIEEAPLDRGRRLLGWATLACFGLLFMPSPWVVH
jgi:Zn-dependent protease